MLYLKIIFALIFLVNTSILSAQECFEYHKSNCQTESSNFFYQENKASVSFLFQSGESRIIPFEMFAGKDYRITICAENIFNEVIKLNLIKENGKVIYDNSKNNYALNMEFHCPKSQITKIKVSVPDMSDNNNSSTELKGCIGIIVEEMVSPKTGF